MGYVQHEPVENEYVVDILSALLPSQYSNGLQTDDYSDIKVSVMQEPVLQGYQGEAELFCKAAQIISFPTSFKAPSRFPLEMISL